MPVKLKISNNEFNRLLKEVVFYQLIQDRLLVDTIEEVVEYALPEITEDLNEDEKAAIKFALFDRAYSLI